MAKWFNIYNPNEIADRIDKAKSVNKNGKVSFQGFEHYDYTVVLNSMVIMDETVPELEKNRIVNQATFKAAAIGKIDSRSLLAEINKLESEYLKRPEKKFKLVTSISVDRFCTLKPKKVNNCTINFKSSLSSPYLKAISEIFDSARHSIIGDIPKNYKSVIITLNAKSNAEAANKALDSIDLIRGIWNLYENRKHGIRISSGKRKPVNKFILGPLHTLHEPDGKLATKTWWYDPEYVYQVGPFNPSKDLEKIYEFENTVRKLLDKNKYSKEIVSAILRYTRALDLTNWEDAFLRLWSVLEHLTATGPNESYNITIRRAAFIYRGDEYSRQVLTHLKDYRNRTVHAGSENHEIQAYMYQLKRFVESLLEFHLGNKFGFNSLREVSTVLDLPCNRDELCKKREALIYAEKFLGYKK